MSDPDPTAADGTQVCWELSTSDQPRRSFASAPGSSAQALDMVLLGFLDETRTDTWDDVDTFAAIARDYATLEPREIAGLLGIDLLRVVSAPSPGAPPWTLSHPTNDSEITLEMWEKSG